MTARTRGDSVRPRMTAGQVRTWLSYEVDDVLCLGGRRDKADALTGIIERLDDGYYSGQTSDCLTVMDAKHCLAEARQQLKEIEGDGQASGQSSAPTGRRSKYAV